MTDTSDEQTPNPEALKPGTRVRHKNGAVVVLSHRKDDNTGWWLAGDAGGLADWVIDGENWTVI